MFRSVVVVQSTPLHLLAFSCVEGIAFKYDSNDEILDNKDNFHVRECYKLAYELHKSHQIWTNES